MTRGVCEVRHDDEAVEPQPRGRRLTGLIDGPASTDEVSPPGLAAACFGGWRIWEDGRRLADYAFVLPIASSRVRRLVRMPLAGSNVFARVWNGPSVHSIPGATPVCLTGRAVLEECAALGASYCIRVRLSHKSPSRSAGPFHRDRFVSRPDRKRLERVCGGRRSRRARPDRFTRQLPRKAPVCAAGVPVVRDEPVGTRDAGSVRDRSAPVGPRSASTSAGQADLKAE